MTAKGAFKIKRVKYPTGTTTFQVYGMIDGQQIRKHTRDREWAQQECDRLNRERENVRRSLKPMLAEFGTNEAIDAERALKLLGGRATLEEAVSFYLESNKPENHCVEAREALAEYITELDMRVVKKTMRPSTMVDYRNRLIRFFTGIESIRLDKLTPTMVLERIQATENSLTSQDNSRRCVRTFLSWCMEIPRCYIRSNPVDAVKIRKPERSDDIAVLTVDEVEKVMRSAEAHRDGLMAPNFALAVFAGIRPFELERLDWDDIDLNSLEIHIRTTVSKTKQPRTIPIPENLQQWLSRYHGRLIHPRGYTKNARQVRAQAGIADWTPDTLRHTCASFLFERLGAFGKTAEILGNSESIIRKHYRGRVDKTTVDSFWNIRPGGE